MGASTPASANGSAPRLQKKAALSRRRRALAAGLFDQRAGLDWLRRRWLRRGLIGRLGHNSHYAPPASRITQASTSRTSATVPARNATNRTFMTSRLLSAAFPMCSARSR